MPEHRKRLALVYVFTAAVNRAAGAAQRALAALPRKLGWPLKRIRIIDEDIGRSGLSDRRPGFQRLLRLLDRGRVGLVVGRVVSRLSRNALDFCRFLNTLRRSGALLAVNGRVCDLASQAYSEQLGCRIQSLLAWRENQQRVQMVQKAKEAWIHKGYAVSPPPIGYVKVTRGKWVKDDRPGVQEAVRRLFKLYLKLRSTYKVAQYMRQHNLLFPKRVGGEIRWDVISPGGVLTILSNPNYTADYHYGRRRLQPREGTKARLSRLPRSEWIVYTNHHDPYVTREEWEAIQTMLHERGRGSTRRKGGKR